MPHTARLTRFDRLRRSTPLAVFEQFEHWLPGPRCIVGKTPITETFVAVVDPGTRNATEHPQSYFISIRQVSLPVDFRYFSTY